MTVFLEQNRTLEKIVLLEETSFKRKWVER